MSVRLPITLALSLMVNAVLFGAGAIIILSIPELNAYAQFLLPIAVVAGVIVAPVIAWFLAPRMRNRYWQQKQHEKELSGK